MSDGAKKSVPPSAPAAAQRPRTAPPSASSDVVLIGPPTDDGAGVHVIRARDQRLEAGELRTIEEGRPLTGEVVTLAPRKNDPRVCDVKDSYMPPRASLPPRNKDTKGPAQVATRAYRENWDETFARPRRDVDLN